MHPFDISNELQARGFWFTYWLLRNRVYPLTRWQALWMIWVSWNMQRHTDKLLNNSEVMS